MHKILVAKLVFFLYTQAMRSLTMAVDGQNV